MKKLNKTPGGKRQFNYRFRQNAIFFLKLSTADFNLKNRSSCLEVICKKGAQKCFPNINRKTLVSEPFLK